MEVPLTKEQFCEAINSIRDYWDSLGKLEDSLKVVVDNGPFMEIVNKYVDTLCSVMRDYLEEDEYYNDIPWIEKFCWDYDFGRAYKEGDKVGNISYSLATTEDLYDLLLVLYWRGGEGDNE